MLNRTITLPPQSLTIVLAAGLALLASGNVSCPGARVAAASLPATPAPVAPPRLIEVSGSARLDVPPDRVDLTLSLEQKRSSPRAAVTALLSRREALISDLRRRGVRATTWCSRR